MKTLKEIKAELTNPQTGENTLLGMHLVNLIRPEEDPETFNAELHLLEESIEVMAQMEKNGIDPFGEFKLGSVSKAYYQLKVEEYKEY